MRKKTKTKAAESGEKKRVDRFLLFLLTCTTLAFALWAVLASLIAYHYRTKSEMAYVNLQDSRDAMADIKSSSDTQRQSAHNELIHAEILRSEVGSMFRQLLIAEEKPKDLAAFMKTLQTLFGELSGETMSRLEMITLKKTLSELLSVVPDSARPPPRIIKERLNVKNASAALVAERVIKPEERSAAEQALTRLMNGQPPKGEVKAKPLAKPPAVIRTATPVVPPSPAPAKVEPKAPVKVAPVPVKKPAPAKPTHKDFVDKKHGYQVSFPLDWNMKEDADSATVLARSPRKDFSQLYTAYVIITAQQSETPLDLEAFAVKGMEGVEKSMGVYKELEAEQEEMAGLQSKRLLLRFERLGRHFESTYIFCVKGNVGYMLSFTVPEDQVEESKDSFTGIIDSFKFL